jgi:DNA-directed RNA polymerase subunit beta'
VTQTLGQLLVNSILPSDMQVSGPVTKKDLDQKLYTLARQDTADAARRIEKLRQLGHELATTEGISATLDDITPDYALQKKMLGPVLRQMQQTDDPERRQKILAETQPRVVDASRSHSGSFGTMVRSGARGRPVQLSKNILAPVMALTGTGDPVPWLVHHNYAQGLRASEAWATHVETRNNQIDTRLSVTEPGDIGKILVNNMADQLVTSEDCGTSNGIMLGINSGDVIDRYLAKSTAGFPANTLLTPQVLTRIKKQEDSVIVRSPMTCEAHTGVCKKCYGLNEFGKAHPIGTNVGIRSAQALSEPLTQFALSSKHGIRTSPQDKSIAQGHKGLRQLLDIPESFTHTAAIAPIDGQVDKIEKAPQGGHLIFIGQEQIYTPPDRPPTVKPGQRVTAGDVLSIGTANPAAIVKYKGLGTGRQYLTDQLQGIYKRQGLDIDRRHLELLTKSHLNRVRIDDDPSNTYYPGEIVQYNSLLGHLRENAKEKSLKDASGDILASNKLHFTAGTRLTPEVTASLSQAGIKNVLVTGNDLKITPLMRPITRNPLLNPDWLARLGHRYLQESLLQGAHFGEKSKIHSTHPIPALAYGAEFGQGRDGEY